MTYDIVQQLNFKTTICNHYHGDYGTLYSTFADNGRTIWQCACGYRTITNGVVNFSLKEFLDSSENSYIENHMNNKTEITLEQAILAAKQTASNMERMERDLYLKLNDKEKEIEDLRDLLHDCADHLEGQFDPEDNNVMIKKIREFLDKKFL